MGFKFFRVSPVVFPCGPGMSRCHQQLVLQANEVDTQGTRPHLERPSGLRRGPWGPRGWEIS